MRAPIQARRRRRAWSRRRACPRPARSPRPPRSRRRDRRRGTRRTRARTAPTTGRAGRRQAGRLDGRLAEVDGLREPALHLERVALHEHHRHEEPSLAGGAGDRDAAVGAARRVVVALEVVLGPAEVVERLEPRGQLGVRQPLDQRDRLRAVRPRVLGLAGGHLPEAQRGGGGGGEQSVVAGARGLERAAAHRQRPLEVQLVEPVDRQLDLQGRGRGRLAVRQRLPCAGEATVGLLVTAEPVLDRRAARGQLDALGGRVRRAAARARRAASRGSARGRPATAAPGERHPDLDLARRVLRGRSRNAARSQCAAAPGARAALAAPASSSSAIASSSPGAADCSTWCARSAAAAPRAASASAASAWAASRRPPGTDS